MLYAFHTFSARRHASADSCTMPEADATWYQPVAHAPDLRPEMSDRALCLRQPYNAAIAQLLERADAGVEPGELGQW